MIILLCSQSFIIISSQHYYAECRKTFIRRVLVLHNKLRYQLRPLQRNSLFPVHHPHLVTVSSKTSIIPYSSIISGYSGILTGSEKVISKRCQLTCQQCYLVGPHFTLVLFLQLKKEGSSLSMLLCSYLWLCQANNGLKNFQSYKIMKM